MNVVYVGIPTGTNTVSLSMLLTGTVTDRYWNILIAHIPCGTSYTAPDDCLQWFTTTTGTLSSFNFLFSTDPAVQKLAFQDYAICIRANAVRTLKSQLKCWKCNRHFQFNSGLLRSRLQCLYRCTNWNTSFLHGPRHFRWTQWCRLHLYGRLDSYSVRYGPAIHQYNAIWW